MSIEECLALLHQLDNNCSDDCKNSDFDSTFSENEIPVQSSNSSEEEINVENPSQQILVSSQNVNPISPDGIQWKRLDENGIISRRYASGNVLREKTGPTPYAKKNIGGNEVSSWYLLFSESMLKYIQKGTFKKIQSKKLAEN